jgi:protoporphyrinogen oxidase
MSAPVVIIGLGVSGLGCGLELARRGIGFAAFEKEARAGWLARTDRAGDFRFDYGPHILLGAPKGIGEVLGGLPALDLEECSGKSGVMMGAGLDRVVPTPFQRRLNWLPLDVRGRLLFEALANRFRNGLGHGKIPRSYQEFAIQRCGRGVYDLFLRGYEAKRLRFDLDAIPGDWTGRIEKTRLRSLVLPRSLDRWFGKGTGESRFRYPRTGGIEALPRAMARLLPENSTSYGCEAAGIDARAKTVWFANGAAARYERLVLSLPLPEALGLIRDAPPEVRRAADDLIYTSIYVVSFGFEGTAPEWSLVRIPAPRWDFYRLSFPSNYARGAAPQGSSAVVGEIGHHAVRRPLTAGGAREALRRGLEELGILRKGQPIAAESVRDIRYGHVLYNRNTRASVRTIHEYLRRHSILVCGKYGEWRDMLIPESIASGMAAADEIAASLI